MNKWRWLKTNEGSSHLKIIATTSMSSQLPTLHLNCPKRLIINRTCKTEEAVTKMAVSPSLIPTGSLCKCWNTKKKWKRDLWLVLSLKTKWTCLRYSISLLMCLLSKMSSSTICSTSSGTQKSIPRLILSTWARTSITNRWAKSTMWCKLNSGSNSCFKITKSQRMSMAHS